MFAPADELIEKRGGLRWSHHAFLQ